MTITGRMDDLESRYHAVLSASLAAKAHYLALLEEPSATTDSRNRARQRWENLNTKQQGIAAQMGGQGVMLSRDEASGSHAAASGSPAGSRYLID